MTVPDYVSRFYHDLQWNSLTVLDVGRVTRIECVLSLLADLLDEQGQRSAALQVREWQQHQEAGLVSAG